MARRTKEARTVEVAGKQLTCQICGHTEFWERNAQMNTRGLTFLGWDWANKQATCEVCTRCGYVHWFLLE